MAAARLSSHDPESGGCCLCSSPLSFHSGTGSERPGAVKGAPLFGAAERTLAGEDRGEIITEGRKGACFRLLRTHYRPIIPKNLASATLARVVRRLPEDWQAQYGVTPLLLETFVDSEQYTGACYRAANWLEVGQTSGRGRDDRQHRRHGARPKRVFVYPLRRDARVRLRGQR